MTSHPYMSLMGQETVVRTAILCKAEEQYARGVGSDIVSMPDLTLCNIAGL